LEYEPSLEAGFQISMLQGPLCAEPVQGMAYLVESLQANDIDGQDTEGIVGHFLVERGLTRSSTAHSKRSQAKGSLISGTRDACRKGLLDWSPRLMLAMYTCDIQASSKKVS
jgi:ribosome assembly protein 1